MDFHLNGGLSPTNKGISAHTGMPFLIEREPQGYFLHLPKIFYGLKIYEMKTEKIIRLSVSLYLGSRLPIRNQTRTAATDGSPGPVFPFLIRCYFFQRKR